MSTVSSPQRPSRLFTDEELAMLARSPREQFAAALQSGDVKTAVDLFRRIERSYKGFVAGFHDFIGAMQAFLAEALDAATYARTVAIVQPNLAVSAAHHGVTANDLAMTNISMVDSMSQLIGGEHASATGALGRFDEIEAAWRRVHDLHSEWVVVWLSGVYREHGPDLLERCFRYVGEHTILGWMPNDLATEPQDRVRRWVQLNQGNFSSLRIEEDDAAFTLVLDPCGSCGRQVANRRYEPEGPLAVVNEAIPMTWGRGQTPVYRCHVAVMHFMMPIEGMGVPWPIVQCPQGMESGPCRITLHKDPYQIPASEIYESVGRQPPPAGSV